jgi:hypothetical protein
MADAIRSQLFTRRTGNPLHAACIQILVAQRSAIHGVAQCDEFISAMPAFTAQKERATLRLR